MQLGFVSAILPDLTLEQVLDTARELGYGCVELMCWPRGKAERRYAGVTHVEVESLDAEGAARLREQIAESGVGVSGLGYYPNPLSPDPDESSRCIAHLRAVIRAASMLGVTRVNTFVGRDPARSVDDNWPRFLEVWRAIVAFAEEHSVRIGIENCPMLFTADEWPGGKNLAHCPAVWRRMFDDIPSDHFGLNYDPSHLLWQQIDYTAPLHEFAGRLFHVHAKDVLIDRDRLNDVGVLATPLQYHDPKLPGLGEIDWERFFPVLGNTGYTGPVCVEVEDRAYEHSLDARKEALRHCAAFLKDLLP